MSTPADRLQSCLAFTRSEEGGFQNEIADSGNWWQGKLLGTYAGISAPTLAAWVGPECAAKLTADDMRALDDATISAIYAANYWNVVRGHDLPLGVDLMVFDFGVTAGPGTSAKLLQAALRHAGFDVVIDGHIGPRTLAAAATASAAAII